MADEMTPVYQRIEEMAAEFGRDVVGILREAPLQELVELLANDDAAPPLDTPTAAPDDDHAPR